MEAILEFPKSLEVVRRGHLRKSDARNDPVVKILRSFQISPR